MYDTNYYMEKLRKGMFVEIMFPHGITIVLHREIMGYVATYLNRYDGYTLLAMARRSKREVFGMIDWAVAHDRKIGTWRDVE